ncbi:hypothetical protein AB7303_17595 [Providencia rettgeri]|uniref:hypothetical protein n=1 Tax=Providencia alcalifaciens TaxID=126385 RepID=UPI000450A8D5|nr:hypothetical protein [Providencia alcalifaciens]ETT07307.1 hypothetical protein HMPREF1562_3344 [Providencia alcalifaciens F90-2004]
MPIKQCPPATVKRVKKKSKPGIISVISGVVIKAPERGKTVKGKVYATMTIEAVSESRNSYPLRLVAFDIEAIELMMCKRGDNVTAKGSYGWFNGYQLSGAKIVIC